MKSSVARLLTNENPRVAERDDEALTGRGATNF